MKKVYLVVYGPFSQCSFMVAGSKLEVKMMLPKEERACALVTETDMDPNDLELRQEIGAKIQELENEITEVKMNLINNGSKKNTVA